MKRRLPALAYGMRIDKETAQKLIAAAAILHNICIDAHEPTPPIEFDEGEFKRLVMDAANTNNDGEQVVNGRQRLARDEIVALFRTRA